MTPEVNEEKQEVINLKDVIEANKKIKNIVGLRVLSKSQFYYSPDSNKDLREHVASYKQFAIMLKSNHLREDQGKTVELFPSLVKLDELQFMKKVNGNIVRKLKPRTLSVYELMPMIQSIVHKIDNSDF